MQPQEPNNTQEPQLQQITVTIRRICCSQCSGMGVEVFRMPRSPLDTNQNPMQQIVCRQCEGNKFIEVMVPIRMPSKQDQTNSNESLKDIENRQASETKAPEKILQP
jgi:hypothetical protein